MRDEVGEALAARAGEQWPWRSALATAVVLHVAIAVLVVVAPTHRRRALQLPSVQVRMVAPSAAAPARPAAAPRAAEPAAAQPAPAARKPAPSAAMPPRRSATAAARKEVAPPAPVPAAPPPAPLPAAAAADAGGGAAQTGQRTAGGGIALGAGPGNGAAGGGGEPFPFGYYLDRLLSAIEGNWFRPPAPPEARCRVRCRVDRGGRLLEAGIEEPSGTPAFDRAALRAVYAAAPFPPLPQGFAGQTLTVHLEFGPR